MTKRGQAPLSTYGFLWHNTLIVLYTNTHSTLIENFTKFLIHREKFHSNNQNSHSNDCTCHDKRREAVMLSDENLSFHDNARISHEENKSAAILACGSEVLLGWCSAHALSHTLCTRLLGLRGPLTQTQTQARDSEALAIRNSQKLPGRVGTWPSFQVGISAN